MPFSDAIYQAIANEYANDPTSQGYSSATSVGQVTTMMSAPISSGTQVDILTDKTAVRLYAFQQGFLAGIVINSQIMPYVNAPSVPTVAVNATTGNLNGSYLYKITFVNAFGETTGGTESVSVSPVNQQVDLTNIPTGPYGVTARKIYRTVAGGASGAEKLVATLSDNTTTTYTDNVADVSLGANLPSSNTAQNMALYETCVSIMNVFNDPQWTTINFADSSAVQGLEILVQNGVMTSTQLSAYLAMGKQNVMTTRFIQTVGCNLSIGDVYYAFQNFGNTTAKALPY